MTVSAMEVSMFNGDPVVRKLNAEIERLRTMIEDACKVFDHYDLPEHAFHYRREIKRTHEQKASGRDKVSVPHNEYCQNCCWIVAGLFLPGCSNRLSEFYRGSVHPHGWCPEWNKQNGDVVPLRTVGQSVEPEVK